MQVSFLLEKYKTLGYSQKRIKEIILGVFLKKGIKISIKEIEVKDTEVKINISGVLRTHFILLKSIIEQEIQTELQKEGLKITHIF